MNSSQSTEECGYGQGIASGWKSSGRGTKLQISAPARGERAVPGRRQVHRARRAAGSRGSGRPTGRPCRPSRRRRAASGRSAKPWKRAARASPRSSRMPSSIGPAKLGRAEVAVAVRRVHAQLADLVAPLLRAGARRPGTRSTASAASRRRRGRSGAAARAARRRSRPASKRRSPSSERSSAAALVDEEQLVGVAVDEVDRVGCVGQHAPTAPRPALNSSGTRASIGRPGRRRQRPACGSAAWPAARGSVAAGAGDQPCCTSAGDRGVRPALVVDDRVRAVEAVAREALLVAQARRRGRARRCGACGGTSPARRGRASDHAAARCPRAARARCSRTARGSCRRRSLGRPCAG